MPFSIGTSSPGDQFKDRKRCREIGCRNKAAFLSRHCGNHAFRCRRTSCYGRTQTLNSECRWHVNARAKRASLIQEKELAPLAATKARMFRDAVSRFTDALQSSENVFRGMSAYFNEDYKAIFVQMCEQVQDKTMQHVAVTEEMARKAAEKEPPPQIEEPESLVDGFANLSI